MVLKLGRFRKTDQIVLKCCAGEGCRTPDGLVVQKGMGTDIIIHIQYSGGTAVAQWLRCCVTNRKVAGSIPASVIGIFH